MGDIVLNGVYGAFRVPRAKLGGVVTNQGHGLVPRGYSKMLLVINMTGVYSFSPPNLRGSHGEEHWAVLHPDHILHRGSLALLDIPSARQDQPRLKRLVPYALVDPGMGDERENHVETGRVRDKQSLGVPFRP